jgi:hypothetical protein
MFIFYSGIYVWALFSRHFKALYDPTYTFTGVISSRLAVPLTKKGTPLYFIMIILLSIHIPACEYTPQRRISNLVKALCWAV